MLVPDDLIVKMAHLIVLHLSPNFEMMIKLNNGFIDS